jgi:hypothetical protein
MDISARAMNFWIAFFLKSTSEASVSSAVQTDAPTAGCRNAIGGDADVAEDVGVAIIVDALCGGGDPRSDYRERKKTCGVAPGSEAEGAGPLSVVRGQSEEAKRIKARRRRSRRVTSGAHRSASSDLLFRNPVEIYFDIPIYGQVMQQNGGRRLGCVTHHVLSFSAMCGG